MEKLKFKIGDKGYVIGKKWSEEACKECCGNGKVAYKNRKIDCPDCDGSGYTETSKDKVYEVNIVSYHVQQGRTYREVKYGVDEQLLPIKEECLFHTHDECLERKVYHD